MLLDRMNMRLDQMSEKMDDAQIDRDKFLSMGVLAFILFAAIGVVNGITTGSIVDALAWGTVGVGLLVIALIPAGVFHVKYKKAHKAYGDALDRFFKISTK